MSGIAAVYRSDGRMAEPTLIETMVQAMAHRGPDGLTWWADGAIGLGHGLMHTTPESLRERQPVSDGTRWLVWDGRLDNREELLRTLKTEGIPRGEETDPELVLGAYRLWGGRCVDHLLGEFAVVVWDARAHTVFGARDRIGLKPLYYTRQDGAFLIASEAKALLAVLDRMPEPDDELVLAMLLSECREPDNHRSLFSGIHRLPPGHLMTVTEGRLAIQRYWQVDPSKQTLYKRPEAYVEHFRALYEEAVRRRTRSAFPVGCLLSGGLDSSSITALAASHGTAVEAFTAFSQDPASDERRYARQVCQAAGIPHWEFTGTCDDPLQGLDELLWEVESPLVSTDRNKSVLTALLHSRHCRVVLTGEGGDHLLDEDGYLADLILRANPVRFLRETKQFAKWYGVSAGEIGTLALQDAVAVAPKMWAKRMLRRIPMWINQDMARMCRLQARMLTPRAPLAFPFRCQTVTCQDILSPYFLLKLELAERDAASAGRETWYPLLDSRLVEFILSIPWNQRCHQGERKWLLRQAMHGVLSESVRLRQGKGDWTQGMDQALAALCRRDPPELLTDRSGMLERYVNVRGAGKMIQRYRRGDRRVRWDVWSFVALDHWLKVFWTEGGWRHAQRRATRQATVQHAEVALLR